MHLKFACLFIALATFGMSAHAEVVRCTGADGKVSYSDVACPTSTTNITAVRTEMASPGEQLDSYQNTHSTSTRAPQAGTPSAATTTRLTRTIVVRHVIVVRPVEHPRVQAPAPVPHTPAPAPHAPVHAGHR